MANKATVAEQAHMGRVANQPCSLCGKSAPSIVHHIREGQGTSQRASNWLTVALCHDCHVSPIGVHGDKRLMKIYKVEELDLLAKTIENISGNYL